MVQLSHPYMNTGKTIALTVRTFVGKVMSLLLISYLDFHSFPSKEQASFNFRTESPSEVILDAEKRKSVTVSTFSPSFRHEVMEPDANDLRFFYVEFQAAFSLSSFTFIKRL